MNCIKKFWRNRESLYLVSAWRNVVLNASSHPGKRVLLREYLLEGYDIFEEENGKYFVLIKNET